jgi:hypothetical protein
MCGIGPEILSPGGQSCGMIKELPYFQGGKAGGQDVRPDLVLKNFFGFIGNDGTST